MQSIGLDSDFFSFAFIVQLLVIFWWWDAAALVPADEDQISGILKPRNYCVQASLKFRSKAFTYNGGSRFERKLTVILHTVPTIVPTFRKR